MKKKEKKELSHLDKILIFTLPTTLGMALAYFYFKRVGNTEENRYWLLKMMVIFALVLGLLVLISNTLYKLFIKKIDSNK